MHSWDSWGWALVTTLMNRSPELYVANPKRYTCSTTALLPLPPAPGNCHSTFCFYEHTTLDTSCMWIMQYLFVTGLSDLAWCPPGSFMLQHVTGFPFFLRLNNIPLYGYTIFSLPASFLNEVPSEHRRVRPFPCCLSVAAFPHSCRVECGRSDCVAHKA